MRILNVIAAAALVAGNLAHAPAAGAANLLAGLPIDGIRCDQSEGALEHIHTHLQMFQRGRAVGIPGRIGIPEGAGCLYWVHTHRPDGMIHIESPVRRTFTLGQFFDVWHEDLSRTRAGGVTAPRGRTLRVTVNGKPWRGDPRSVPLADREEIVIQAGPPYVSARPADWSQM